MVDVEFPLPEFLDPTRVTHSAEAALDGIVRAYSSVAIHAVPVRVDVDGEPWLIGAGGTG